MMNRYIETKVNHGFDPSKMVLDPRDYMLGSSPLAGVVIRPDSDWLGHIPEYEIQRKAIETYNCTAFGTTNMIETLLYAQHNVVANYSDRFLGVMAGTWPPGNSPHTVMETVRKSGLVNENLLPFTDEIKTLEEYYSPAAFDLIKKAKEFNAAWDFGHEWVFFMQGTIEEKQNKLLEALKYSPVGVSVMAWRFDTEQGVYVKNPGEPDTHWVELVKGKRGEPWYVYDSYDQGIKKLAWDFDFGYAKRISISKRAVRPSFWARFVAALKSFFS